jgi:cell division septal protein FtsQ
MARKKAGPMVTRNQNGKSKTSGSSSRKPVRKKRKIGRKILLLLILGFAVWFGISEIEWNSIGGSSFSSDDSTETNIEENREIEAPETIEIEVENDSLAVSGTAFGRKFFATVDSLRNTKFRWLSEAVDEVFEVRSIDIKGALCVPEETILCCLDTVIGKPVYDLDLKALASKIKSHPRIKNAVLQNSLPKLVVRITERREEAVLLCGGVLYGLDEDNVVMPSPEMGFPLDVPVITGFSGTVVISEEIEAYGVDKALEWIRTAYTVPRVGGWISEIHLENEEITWINGSNGWMVQPGEHSIIAQIAALNEFLTQKNIENEKAKLIDLRFSDFLIVKNEM